MAGTITLIRRICARRLAGLPLAAALIAAPCLCPGQQCSQAAKAQVISAFGLETHGAEKADVIAGYTKAILTDPSCAPAYAGRGGAYMTVDKDKAVADFTKAIKLDPRETSSYFNRADLYSEKGMLNEALADISACLDMEPDPGAERLDHYRRGKIYARLGKHKAAIADYTEAIKLGPAPVEASTSAPAAVDPAPGEKKTVYPEAPLLRSPETGAAAHRDGQAGMAGDFGSLIAANSLKLEPAGKKEQPAAKAAVAPIPLDITYGWARLARGISYIALKDYDKAIVDLTLLLGHNPGETGAYFNRAAAYRAKGLNAEAAADEASFKAAGGRWALP